MNELKSEILTSIANTTFAMLALLRQLHLNLHQGVDFDSCLECNQYLKLSQDNRALFEKINNA